MSVFSGPQTDTARPNKIQQDDNRQRIFRGTTICQARGVSNQDMRVLGGLKCFTSQSHQPRHPLPPHAHIHMFFLASSSHQHKHKRTTARFGYLTTTLNFGTDFNNGVGGRLHLHRLRVSRS